MTEPPHRKVGRLFMYNTAMNANNHPDTDHSAAHRAELLALLFREHATLVREVQDATKEVSLGIASAPPPAGRSFGHLLRRGVISGGMAQASNRHSARSKASSTSAFTPTLSNVASGSRLTIVVKLFMSGL